MTTAVTVKGGSACRIPWARPVLWGNEATYAREAVESTHWSAGPFLERLEAEFAALLGVGTDCCLAVANGTAALHLPLLALGLQPDDEVVITGWGFAAAANMTRLVGAKPVFCDVDADSWVATAETIAPVLSSRTRAVVVIHNYGIVSPMTEIVQLLRDRNIVLVEDCAESLFSRIDGDMSGSFADIAIWSFQATKTISCGEGGMVVSKSAALTEKMRLVRSHGMRTNPKYVHWELGHNFRLTNVQAAIAVAQLEKREEIIRTRRHVYDRYRASLNHLPVRLQHVPPDVEPVMWGLGMIADERVGKSRGEVMARLDEAGIETRPGFVAFSAQPIYRADPLPVSDRLSDNVFSLPFPPDLKDEDIDYIASSLAAVLA